jgi:hypothetical protein
MNRSLIQLVACVTLALGGACGGDARPAGSGGTGGAGAAGAGGGGPAGINEEIAEPVQIEESTYEAQVALVETNAAADLAELDVSVTVPGGFSGLPAGAEVTAAKGPVAGPLDGRPDGYRPDRVDIGRMLRALARVGAMPPCDPPPTIEKMTATSDCRLIGRMGTYPAQVKVTFAGCTMPAVAPGAGTRIDGTFTMSNQLALAEGATCDLAGLKIDVSHDLTTDLTISSPDGARAVFRGMATAHGQKGREASLTRSTTLDQTRQRFAPDGLPLLDQKLVASATHTLDLSTMPPALVTSATAMTQLGRIGASATVTATDLRNVADCCYPVGGTVAVDATRRAHPPVMQSIAFGPACGQAIVDGTAATLRSCR